ncbi:CD209 antigen-like protein E [Danio aesculapii]|uniref:CD209 antigen-like protein E n=1 Tax=Danio aesculapii TaxID=1142201 RepID=UPI0024C033D5|nr:CD209 antigen-like protein E [Danio aesculapii]
MASKRPKIYKRDNANDTGEMDRKDVEKKIAVVRSRHVRTEAENASRHQTCKHTDYLRIGKAAPVCLVLMCVAMLTVVVVMAVDLYTMIEEFHVKNKNHTDEIDNLKTRKKDLERNVEMLIESNKALKEENPKIQEKVEELWKQIGKMDGWRCNQSSLYFISSEKKNWTESRRDCKERGADLIIIESKEEQEFVEREIGVSDSVWIGLTDSEVEGTWTWVNGTSLSPGFWGAGEPSGTSTNDEDCAVNLSLGFGDYPCKNPFKWICERQN